MITASTVGRLTYPLMRLGTQEGFFVHISSPRERSWRRWLVNWLEVRCSGKCKLGLAYTVYFELEEDAIMFWLAFKRPK
jgi:hypothetical protein